MFFLNPISIPAAIFGNLVRLFYTQSLWIKRTRDYLKKQNVKMSKWKLKLKNLSIPFSIFKVIIFKFCFLYFV